MVPRLPLFSLVLLGAKVATWTNNEGHGLALKALKYLIVHLSFSLAAYTYQIKCLNWDFFFFFLIFWSFPFPFFSFLEPNFNFVGEIVYLPFSIMLVE